MRLGIAFTVFLIFAPAAMAETVWITDSPEPLTLTLSDGRLLLLDGLMAPEADGNAMSKSKAALITAAIDKQASISPLRDGPDRWGRIPADVTMLGEDDWLQGALLEAGYALVAACPRGDADRLARLRRAEAIAREARRGLWKLQPYWTHQANGPMRADGFAIVEGVAVDDGGSRNVRYLNFDKNWRNDFTLRAARRVESRLKRAGLEFKTLIGKPLRARGWLFYNNVIAHEVGRK
ncbi:MAG: thermonuclease family protein, partial [Alphaproteobacteria bacterium]